MKPILRGDEIQNHTLTLNLREDDSKWPQKNKDGRQELEIRLGNEHISFEVWHKWTRSDASVTESCDVLTPFADRENRLFGGCD